MFEYICAYGWNKRDEGGFHTCQVVVLKSECHIVWYHSLTSFWLQ